MILPPARGKKGLRRPFVNDENSPSGAICPAITALTCLQTSSGLQTAAAALFPALLLSSILQLTIKLLKSVETGSTLSQDVLTQSCRGQAGCLRVQHLCQICEQNPQLGRRVLSGAFHSANEMSTFSRYLQLRRHILDLAGSAAAASHLFFLEMMSNYECGVSEEQND